MKKQFTLFLLMLVLSTSNGWTMSDDDSEANTESEIFVELRDFVFNLPEEKIERTETILGKKMDVIKELVLIQSALASQMVGNNKSAQDDYDKLIATANQAVESNADRASAIAKATWIAILHPTITIQKDIQHGLGLHSTIAAIMIWVPINFV